MTAEQELAELRALLQDPEAVRANILRGTIKVPSDLVWLFDTDGPVSRLTQTFWDAGHANVDDFAAVVAAFKEAYLNGK